TSGTFSVSLTGTSAEYDGGAHSATLNGTQSGDGIQYFVREGGVWIPVSYTPSVTNVNDGPKEIKVIVSRTGYSNAEATATLTITPVEVTVTADSRSMTFGNTTTLTPAEGVTYAGFVNSETSSVVSGAGTINYTYRQGATVVTVDNDLPVGSYSITPNIGGLTATNYTFVPGSGTLAVGIATMTVGSLGYNGTYDGDPHDLVATASIDGMTILYSATEGSGYSEDCPSYTNAGTYTVYFKAVDPDGNYADATGSADIVITKAVLTVTADDRSMTYGDMASLTAEGASYSGFADGDSLSNIGMTGSVTFGYFAGATSVTVDATLGAGGYTIKPNVSALSSANYTFTPGNGTLTVNKAIMTVGAIDVTHVYDGTAYSVIANAIPDDPNTVIYYNTTGGTMLSDYFEEIPEAIDVADSTRVYFLAVNPNYEDATGSAMLTITPAVITVTADNRSMTYGDTTTLTPAEGVTYAGFVNSETSSVISDAGSITYTYQEGAALVTVDNTLDAGGYSIIPGVGGLSAANYSFVPGNGTLTVNRATGLAINATSYNEKYDGGEHGIGTSPTPAEGTTLLYSLTGGTNLSAYTLTSNPMFKNAMSAKTVYVAAVNDNYVTVFDQATVTIARRTIKLASDSETRPYNGSPLSLPDVAVTGDGFVTGEGFVTDPQSTVSITNVSSVTNAYSYPAFIPGTNVDNYAFQKTEGTLEITAVEVTVTADDQSMTYGDSSATPAAGVSYSGFVNSETASVVSGTVGYNYYDGATEVFIGSTLGAGSYDITPDLSGITATNYTFKAADGTLTVNPATMEVTSDGYNELYDGAPHGLEAEVTGLTGMTITYSDSVTGTFTNASPEYTNVGTYTVYFKAVDPDGNYADATGSAQIIIRKVQVTVTADNRIMTYGDTTTMTPAEGVTYAGFVNGENATSAGVTGLVNYYYYDSLWELVGVSNTLDAGIYTIKPSVFWLSAANYTFVPADGTLTVNKATMTVDSSGTLAVYDGFPYDLTATASVDGMTILYSATADGTYGSVCPSYTNAGTYTVYFKAIDPDGNYAEATGHADIVITKAVLTVRAIDRSMTYGDMSSLTVEDASFSGFAFGDNLSNIGLTGSVGYYYFDSATLVTVDATLDAGSYTITPYVGSLNSANYTFVPADGTLTVSPATMEVTSLGYEDYYDGAAHGLTASVTGLSGMTITYSDSPSGTFTSASPEYTNAGTYTVYFKAVDPDGNYADATGSAEINIRQVEVTVTADDQNMMYGDTTAPAETVSYSGFVNGENATSAGVTGDVLYSYYDSLMYMVAVSSTLDAGLYTITPDVGGLSATNYSFVPADGTLTVAKSDALDVSADDVEAPYDGFPYMVSPNVNDWNGTDVWYSLTDSTDPADYSMTPPSLVNVGDSARVYLMATNLNYENAFGSALVTITPVELTVTPDDQYMIYGDTTLPAESSVITGFVNGENETTAGVSGSIDYNYFDGTTPVTVSSTLPAGDYTIEVGLSNLTAPNYTFTNASGALNVARSESLTVDATDISEMYNGGTHMVTPLASDMSADTTIWYSLTDSTDPADYSTTPPALVNVSDSATVYLMATNPNYYPAFGEAEVDITPRTIAIVTNGANKVYDATPLTDNGWSLGAGNDGFASTEGFLSAEAVGTITNAGFVFNTFDYTLTSNTLPGNYDFDITEGVLIISARPVIVALDPAEKNSGDPDPAFTFHYLTFPGLYDVLPGTGATVNLIRTDALAVTSEDIGVHTDVLSINVVFADATAASNYAIVPQNADFTIHPQVTYNLDTLDAVTGFPATEWFDYLSDATIADATGVARLGYVLTGWTDDLTGDPIALGETITGIDRNYSLTAVWELARYNVFYNANTAMDVNNMPGTQVNIPYTSLTALSDRVPTRAGFTFVHWDTAEVPGQISYDPGETFTMPNSDVTFSAVWEPDLTPVYYHANGGVGGTIEDGPFGTLTTVTVAGNGFTRPGYRFIGWSTTPTGAVSAQPGDTFMMPILQVNYYAQWEQVLYTVTYIVNGGTTAGLDGAVPYAEYTDLAYGDAMPVPADPAQDGYTFAGWTTAVPATVPEGGLTIYGTMTENTPEIIPDEPTPLAGASWALLNLILAIATALGSVLMLIGLIGKKRKEELEGVVVRETKKHPVTRLMTLLPAIGGIIAFILTENMKNPMTFVDRWTILMAVIAVLQIALVILGVKKDKEVDPESAK
ncbi:MAG: MBG domain-containing protein, partial [Clostridiaceae bacterium]